MRVVLSTYGSRGDVEPLAGLALRLRESGAEVKVCAPPDEEFAARLAEVGVGMVPVGQSVRALVTGRIKGTADFPQRAAALVEQFYEAVLAVAEPDGVVAATGLFPAVAGAQAAAEKLGARFAYIALQPTMLPSPHHRPFEYPWQPYPAEVTDNRELWELNIGTMNALFGAPVNTHRTAVGLPAVDNVRDHVLTDRPWLATDPTLDPWLPTADREVVQTGAWILPDERPLPANLEAFLTAGEAPVYVGFGSMPLGDAAGAARVAVEAVRAQGRRVLLGRGWAELAGADGACGADGASGGATDCFAVGEVNQQALFRRVAAVVHHGGAGTTTTATRAGVPQVLVPQIVDQPYWAARVADLGIGVAHDGPTPTVESLTAALRQALAPETAERAAAVAGEVRTDGTAVAAALVLEAATVPAVG
ncbi:glycosyltransferase [Streptomyces sp. 1331.2]|uniref:glycosyltransferase n=1 Tax=Streptomyces sp. 1331.2 TaxID=1938835 RepID=UPI000BC81E9D|nr:glycosyltransferase [Streptomyces sp. 1331.2]SOB81065.1 vancomycin aglycone glucosyltransferase [Streptomyces sp. 1331.2]